MIGSVVMRPTHRPRGTAPVRRRCSARRPPRSRWRGEQRRVPGPQPAIDRPWIAAEGCLEASREIRLVDLAPGDRAANRPPHPQPGRARRARAKGEGRDVADRRDRQPPEQELVQPRLDLAHPPIERPASPSTARPPSHAIPSRRSQAMTQSWSARRRSGRAASVAAAVTSTASAAAAGPARSPGTRPARRGTVAPPRDVDPSPSARAGHGPR